MPKRRVRTASQIAASRRNLEKARKAKARSNTDFGGKKWRGPMTTLYHATTPEGAKAIRRNGFQWKEGRNLSMNGVKDPIWFSTKPPGVGSSPVDWVHEKFGQKTVKTKNGMTYPKPVLFSVRVRYKKTHRDKHVPPGSRAIPSRVMSAAYLRGKKIREIK